jgi:molecular chaperone DnaK (HSP70)
MSYKFSCKKYSVNSNFYCIVKSFIFYTSGSFVKIVKFLPDKIYRSLWFFNPILLLKKQEKIRLSIGLLFILLFNNAFAQHTYRRHFIIAYDISSPSINAEKSCPAYKQAIIDLFSNKPVSGSNESNQDNLIIEKNNGVQFFDLENDEVSFFHFNISGNEISILRSTSKNVSNTKIVNEFNKVFLKDKKYNWSNNNTSIKDYFNKAFSTPVTPPNFGGGVSLSNFVYPLVLNQIDTSQYAKEYIVILLSDFLTGSMLGNTKDLDRIRDIYSVPYGVKLPDNSPVSFIKSEIDKLAAQYYRIDFFQYAFVTPSTNNLIGIIGFKVKPKIGILTPEDVALFVDGDLSLNQRGYQSQKFKTNKTKIKFTHNKNLIPTSLVLTITIPYDNTSISKVNPPKVIFQDDIASLNDEGKWQSKYTNDDDLMVFDSINLTYEIPVLKLKLDPSINNKKFDNLEFKYEFKTKYQVTNSQPLNLIYSTERALQIDNIDFSKKLTLFFMYIFLPLLAIFCLVVYLANNGKPRSLFLSLDGYLDSFEIIDYKTLGKLLTPYKAWNIEKQTVDHLLVKGEIRYKSPDFLFNWNPLVHLRLRDISVPEGFEMFLKHDTEDVKEFALDNPLSVKRNKNNKFSFVVGIRQNDITKKIIEPELIKFKVEAVVSESFLIIKSEIRELLEYKFHIGVDLEDVWAGFDPGTSGSCVAIGSATDNIILGKDRASHDIIPSVLVFDKSENYYQDGNEISDIIYKHGTAANDLYPNTSKYTGYQSIKKLLGYKDIKEINFENGNTLKLTGKDLASLLVKGLFKDINTYFNRDELNADDYKRGKPKVFNPKRAVVAIPNNFTISKIQDMVDCIGNLNQFKEIRYVYEAEAVLFYYLSNYNKLNNGKSAPDEETILVFDMGGATINATVVTANKTLVNNRSKYEIDFLGKIGYGIGGDTIDYCIIKTILSFTKEFPAFKGVDIMKNKIQLAEMAKVIKIELVRSYYNTSEENLINSTQLESAINHGTGLAVEVSKRTQKFDEINQIAIEQTLPTELYKLFKREKNNRCKLFEHPIFIDTIYNNVKDAVNEVFELSDRIHIDKVIFSGRSTSFPMIKETVEKQLKSKENSPVSIVLNLEESKIAVAKGACWYGINKNSVELNNLKTNASFGFKKTLSADKTDTKFYELVEMGCPFNIKNDDIDSYEGIKEISDDFAFDGSKVNFYQIMGKDADKILSEDQKHKFSKIATINLDLITSKVAMKVNENDEVECVVKLESNQIIKEKGVVSDQEIDEANQEHYTWIVK